MENANQENLFGLNVDSPIRMHLIETVKWGKFLAIVGFIICGLLVITSIYLATELSSMSRYRTFGDPRSGVGAVIVFFYIIVAVLYFFPCLFLLRFCNKMKTALSAEDQALLTESFQNLKILFRYVGILTIIIIAFYVLVIIANTI